MVGVGSLETSSGALGVATLANLIGTLYKPRCSAMQPILSMCLVTVGRLTVKPASRNWAATAKGVTLMTAAAVTARRVRTPQQYIIEGIMPAGQVHLLAGPSGGGKTTLVFQMMEAIAKGEEFLGHKCKAVPQAYISCDRNIESV